MIVEAVRTPVGRGSAEKGYYRTVHPAELLGRCFVEVLGRVDLDAREVENVFGGCVHQIGEQSSGITRNAWLGTGLPYTTGATTIDTRCGSSQQAIHIAATRIQTGVDTVVVAGGVEHMGHVGFKVNDAAQEQFGRAYSQELLDRYALVSQGEAAELIAERWSISREEMDELALRSHRLAQQATVDGKFEREILPITADGETHTTDQGIRPDTSLEALAQLKPSFRRGGNITAGNSSQISDGAAALLLMSSEKADAFGLRPRAKVLDQVSLGVDPETMLTGPIPATARILARNKMTLDDVDLVEVNEAFAPVVLAWAREHQPDMDRVNTRGGAIALGHPLGATGARLMTTLLHALEDEDKEIGLVTMCCGGGIGTASLIQRI
ncbi:MAG: thiolase family protein [Gaiella sp.]|nr:thiolase family protein [Gaiella sp.]